MPIDPRIALGVQPAQLQLPDPNAGMNALARAMQIRGMQDEQQVNALKMDEYKRGIEDQNALRSALSAPGADPYNSLLKLGKVKEATDFAKGQADVTKLKTESDAKQIEIAHKRVDSWGQAMGFVRQNPTPENAVAAVQHLVTMGVMPKEMAQQALAGVQNDPQSITQWATQGFQAALQAKDQLPKYETRNTGGTTDTLAIDPVTGQVRVANTVQNTQSPDNKATNARVAADAAASRAQSDRHFNATQAASNGAVEYMQTPDGVIALPKKLPAGQAPTGTPVTVSGQPVAGKPSAATEKALMDINQQKAIVAGALDAVKKTPDAFGFTRGLATMAGAIPESVAGRFDSDQQRQARSYLFNNVSKVINERAGAAQSAQELARLRSFLPGDTDKADQIVSKLEAFQTYLGDLEAGTRGKAPASPASPKPTGGTARVSSDAEYNALPSGTVFVGPDGKQRRKP